MTAKRALFSVGLTLSVLVVSLLMWSGNMQTTATGLTSSHKPPLDSNAPLTTAPPPATCGYCSHNLVGKTAAEVGQYAQSYVKEALHADSVPQVLLTRLVDSQGLADLGLGCGVNFAAIEEPPMMLTILKGDFDYRGAAPGFGQSPPPVAGKDRYIVYVFDAWAGTPVVIMASEDGVLVKRALQDPALSDIGKTTPEVCPTPIPASQKRYHYGDAAEGFVVPTHIELGVNPSAYDNPVPQSTAVPAVTYVAWTPTPGAPPPLPTATNP